MSKRKRNTAPAICAGCKGYLLPTADGRGACAAALAGDGRCDRARLVDCATPAKCKIAALRQVATLLKDHDAALQTAALPDEIDALAERLQAASSGSK